MAIIDEIRQRRVEALRQGLHVQRAALVSLLGDLETMDKGPNGPVDDPKTVALIKKHIVGLQEMVNLGKDPGRSQEQINVLSEFLPRQLTFEEVESIISKVIKTGQAKNIGGVMKFMKDTYAGRYDGKDASRIAKNLLG